MNIKKLQIDKVADVDSWENPIAANGWYDECQKGSVTSFCFEKDGKELIFETIEFEQTCVALCHEDDKQYPSLDAVEKEFGVDRDEWHWHDEPNNIYYDEDSDKYFYQITNGNYWIEIKKPYWIEEPIC